MHAIVLIVKTRNAPALKRLPREIPYPAVESALTLKEQIHAKKPFCEPQVKLS